MKILKIPYFVSEWRSKRVFLEPQGHYSKWNSGFLFVGSRFHTWEKTLVLYKASGPSNRLDGLREKIEDTIKRKTSKGTQSKFFQRLHLLQQQKEQEKKEYKEQGNLSWLSFFQSSNTPQTARVSAYVLRKAINYLLQSTQANHHLVLRKMIQTCDIQILQRNKQERGQRRLIFHKKKNNKGKSLQNPLNIQKTLSNDGNSLCAYKGFCEGSSTHQLKIFIPKIVPNKPLTIPYFFKFFRSFCHV